MNVSLDPVTSTRISCKWLRTNKKINNNNGEAFSHLAWKGSDCVGKVTSRRTSCKSQESGTHGSGHKGTPMTQRRPTTGSLVTCSFSTSYFPFSTRPRRNWIALLHLAHDGGHSCQADSEERVQVDRIR